MASNFIINPSSISFEESKTNIEDWLDTRPDALKWQDFFQASAGQTIIELMAGLSTFAAYQIITGRRESYLPFAENRSSGVAIASTLGYSVFRGANANIRLKMTPNTTKTYQKYEIIGSVLDFDLIVKETTIVNAGSPTFVDCIVGFIKEEEILVNSDLLQTFRFTSGNVSEDFRLYLSGTELNPTKNLVDLISDEFVQVSNAVGALDVFYLNRGSIKYTTGDIFKLEYVELANPEFTVSDVQSNELGITAVEISKVYEEEESLREIKINAPLYNETKFVIKGREDYEKIFTALSTDIITSQGRDYSPAVVQLSYVRENLNMFTSAEKNAFQTELLKARPFGVSPAIISDPQQNNLKLNIEVFLLEKTNEDVLAYVENIVQPLEKQLGRTLDLFFIENQIERASYVKTSRVRVDAPEWGADNLYGKTQFVTDSSIQNDIIFEFKEHIRKSGSSEPDWFTLTSNGDRLQDNEITWERREDYRSNLTAWQANTEYVEDDIVIPTIPDGYVYVCVGRLNLSGTSEPTWPETLVETVDDNQIVWRVVNLVGSPDVWQANKGYLIGDIVVPTTGGDYAYQVVKYRSVSGSSEPSWDFNPDFTTNDGQIKWIARDVNKNTIEIGWNEYFLIENNVTVTFQIIL